MKKIYLALLFSSLCLTQSQLVADDALLAANQNFGPRTTEPEEPKVTPPPPVAPAPAPAPVKPAPVPAPVRVAPAPAPVAAPVSVPPSNQAAQEEVLRRQAAQLQARQMIDEGQRLYYDGKLNEAVAKLEEALRILPRARATEIEASRAKNSLSDAYYRLADAAYRAGDNPKARDLARKALENDRDNVSAENILVKIKWAEAEKEAKDRRDKARAEAGEVTPKVERSPEFVAKQEQIKKLFREGRLFLQTGQYDEAEVRFKQVVLLDRYNEDAYQYISEVNRRRMDSTAVAQRATRDRRIWEVADAWIPSVRSEVRLPEAGTTRPVRSSREEAAILERLNKIVFNSIDFRDANIQDVVKFLSDESRKLDPEGKGVNIVLGTGIVTGPAPAPAAEGQPPAGPVTAASVRSVTLNLKNVSMIEALRYIMPLANLKYRIEPNAVLVLPMDAPEGDMILRFFPVTPGALKTLPTTPAAATTPAIGGVGIGDTTRMSGATLPSESSGDVKQYFTELGVPFPPGSSIKYDERTSKISVRNTPENMEIFEKALSELNIIPSQVEIEAKFIDVSEGDLKELGFQWSVGANKSWILGGGKVNLTGGASQLGKNSFIDTNAPPVDIISGLITGGLRDRSGLSGSSIESLLAGEAASGITSLLSGSILGAPDIQFMINALAQKKNTDVLSAPKVTTISGAQAQIRVVQEFIYPTEFSTPTVGTAGGSTTSVPQAFRTREVGVILNVTPTVGADGYTINLTLVPEVSEFRGFIDYSPPTTRSTSTNSTDTTEVGYNIIQPLFETRNLQTSVVIWDGQTVVLGGLMREDVQEIDDKVPFLGDIPILGRLFRSKVSSRAKRNLLIFVTARLIDPAGNPIHRQDTVTVR